MRTRPWELKNGERIVHGEVASDGSIISGAKDIFLIVRASNVIKIGFFVPFSAPPFILLTQREFQNSVLLGQGATTKSQFEANGYDPAQTANRYSGFYFVAIGPK